MSREFSEQLKKVKLVLFDWGDTLMRESKVFEDVPLTLEYLMGKYALGIATNATQTRASQVLFALECGAIGKYFRAETIFSAGEVPWRKPHPAFFQHIMETSGLGESEICMIGDSFENDVEGPVQLGIPAIWLNRGGSEVRRGRGYTTVFSLLDVQNLL